MPIEPRFSSARSGGRYASRAVASVWPYMTKSCAGRNARRTQSIVSGAIAPPACVR